MPGSAPSNPSPGVRRITDSLLDNREFRQLLHRTTLILLVVLLVPMLLLGALVFLLRDSAHWVDHTDRVIAEVNHVEKLLITMQSGFRGYRLMKEPSVLATYQQARAGVDTHFDILHALVSDNPRQQAVVKELRAHKDRWVTYAETALAQMAAGKTPEELLPDMLAARAIINSAVANAHDLIDEELRLRTERDARLNTIFSVLISLLVGAALLGIPILVFWLQRVLRKVGGVYQASREAAERRAKELQVTLSSIGDAVIATDAEGRVDFINPVAEALMGWSSAEARGRPLPEVFAIFNEETGGVTPNPVERVLRENVVVGLANHTVLRSRDGREHPIEDSAAPIRDEQGRVTGVILVFHDVSEKRATERRLEGSERRLRLLNDLTEATRPLDEPAAIMVVSTRLLGQHLRASRCAYAEVEADQDTFTIVHDYTDGCASVTGRYQLMLFGADVAAELRAGRHIIVRDNNTEGDATGRATFDALSIKAVVCYPLLKEGRLRALMAVHQTVPRAWTDGEVTLIGDVVERCWATIERARAEAGSQQARQRAEADARAARDSAERFRLLSQVVALQVWTATVAGELDYANQECAAYFGGDIERDVLGNAWAQFVHPEDLPGALKAWQAALATGHRYEVEFRLRGRDGVFRWFLVRAQALRDGDGRIAKWFGTNTDIDALKRAQDAAEQASRAKDDFLAALSHELRTPLTPVLMTAAALREDARLPAEIREQLGMMERNISLEARLIDDLLDLTAISRGKLQLRAQPCDAHALIGLAIEIVREDARLKEITLEKTFEAQQAGITADPARFQQVIWNILRNAVKFTPRGGRIAIHTHDETVAGAAWLRIEISDSGIGIDPAMLKQIFQPFDQGGLTGDHRFGGIGLGLAIARAVVDLHGGRISAQSAGANQGATFVIEFPGATQPPAGGAAVATQRPSSPAARPMRLLLVEDHENTLQTLQLLLQRDGHQVITARTVADALAAAAAGRFDLVISDLGLPDGTGNELMEKLRSIHGLRGLALSGYGMEEDLARSQQAGFVAHLVKPVVFAELQRALATLPPA